MFFGPESMCQAQVCVCCIPSPWVHETQVCALHPDCQTPMFLYVAHIEMHTHFSQIPDLLIRHSTQDTETM